MKWSHVCICSNKRKSLSRYIYLSLCFCLVSATNQSRIQLIKIVVTRCRCRWSHVYLRCIQFLESEKSISIFEYMIVIKKRIAKYRWVINQKFCYSILINIDSQFIWYLSLNELCHPLWYIVGTVYIDLTYSKFADAESSFAPRVGKGYGTVKGSRSMLCVSFEWCWRGGTERGALSGYRWCAFTLHPTTPWSPK